MDYWVCHCYKWLALDSMGPSEEPYKMCLKTACCLENERGSRSTGSCSPAILGYCSFLLPCNIGLFQYMCTEQFPMPAACHSGAHGPDLKQGTVHTHAILAKAWVCLSATGVAPVRGRAKIIWKDVQVSGKKRDLQISSEEVIPNEEGNISSLKHLEVIIRDISQKMYFYQ